MNTSAAVASGAHIFVVFGWFQNNASTSSLSGGGLTWTKDVELRATSLHIAIHRALAPSGLASGTTLTATMSAGTPDSIMAAGSFTGIDTVSTLGTTQSTNASTAAWNSGASNIGSAGQFMIGGSFIDNATTTASTPTSPGVELADVNIGAQSETLTIVYKLSLSGADKISGTWDAAAAWIGAGATYNAASAAATSIGFLRRSDAVLLVR